MLTLQARRMSYEIHNMDCRVAMSLLMEPQSVHTCVTSPPYFGLRDYGQDGQLGLEKTPDEFIAGMVSVFREVHRVLRDDGTLWVNIGDSYWTAKGAACGIDPKQPEARRGWARPQDRPGVDGIKGKDLIGIPWMLAFALRADGWYLRQEIIWHKPNPMPESVKDRCTKAHEQIFLFSKSPRYYFDADAIDEPVSPNTHARLSQNVMAQIGSDRAHAGGKTNGRMKAVGKTPKSVEHGTGIKANESFHAATCLPVTRRNKRSVWTVTTKGYKGAHFATFPPDLIEPCILAGAPPGGIVLDPFGGSGTVAYAAEKHGRNSILCDLDPRCEQWTAERIAGLTV